jgi:hypothetical protein
VSDCEDRFSAQVAAALRDRVYSFPKVERPDVEQTKAEADAKRAAAVAPVLRATMFQGHRG